MPVAVEHPLEVSSSAVVGEPAATGRARTRGHVPVVEHRCQSREPIESASGTRIRPGRGRRSVRGLRPISRYALLKPVPLTANDLKAIRHIVREEIERVFADRAGMVAANADVDELVSAPEPVPAWWMAALSSEPDERKRLSMSRARSYLQHNEDFRMRARRFLGLSRNATLTNDQVVAYARHHAETWARARVKNNTTRAAKRAARENRDAPP